jgi:hypothetical protein
MSTLNGSGKTDFFHLQPGWILKGIYLSVCCQASATKCGACETHGDSSVMGDDELVQPEERRNHSKKGTIPH